MSEHKSQSRKRKFVTGPLGQKRQRVQYVQYINRLVPARRNVGLKPEKKTVDIDTSSTISSTASINLLNGIQEGTSFYQRVGRKVSLMSTRVTGRVEWVLNATGPSLGEYIRIMIVYDRQTNGAAPALADILQNVNNAGTATTTSESGLNMNNSERFFVIRDKRIVVGNAASPQPGSDVSIQAFQGTTESSLNIDMYCKLKGLQTHYNGTSNPAVVGDITTGSLYLVIVGTTAVANTQYTFDWASRTRFMDV